MIRKNFSSLALGLVLAACLAAPAQAEDKKEQASEEMQAMMAKAKERGTPGAGHEVLKGLEGEWKVSGRSWMKPGDKPMASAGTSSMSWILDGRWLKQKYKGEWGGESFDGIGLLGYDNVKGEYVSIWLDSMSTGLAKASGQYDAATKTIKDSGTFSCPMTGEKDMPFRSEWKIGNKDKLVYSMYGKSPEGKEYKTMELVYQRAK